jgi:hypothetical protein
MFFEQLSWNVCLCNYGDCCCVDGVQALIQQ